MSVLENIRQLTKTLVLDDPFTASVLLALQRREVKGAGIRVRITKQAELILEYDLEFLNNLTTDKSKQKDIQLGELKRQIYHLCLFHPLYRSGKDNKRAYDLACEISMEKVVPEKQQNENWQTPSKVEEYINNKGRKTVQLPREKNALEYYDILKEFIEDDLPEPRNNDNWGEGQTEELDERARINLEANLLSLLQEAKASAPGSVPHSIDEWINIMLRIPKVNYKRHIKTVLGQAGMSQEITYTRSIPNRRIKQFLGRKNKPAGRLLIYVDASGSMDANKFEEAISEVNHLKKQLAVEVEIVQFSTIMYPGERYGVNKNIPSITRKDYGGTDFTPVVEHFNEQTYSKQCIVFTDGEASTSVQPIRNTMLWIVINSYDVDTKRLPGKSVMVRTDE